MITRCLSFIRAGALIVFQYVLLNRFTAFALRRLTWPGKLLLRFANYLFYDMSCYGTKNLRAAGRGPTLVIAHHPFHFEDPKIVGSVLPRTFAIVGKAPLFDNPYLAFLLTHLFRMFPIFREEDGATREQMKANIRTIGAMGEYVARGNMLLIFPEGHSKYTRRHVDPFKEGPARIAFKAQALLDSMRDPSIVERLVFLLTFTLFGRWKRWESVQVLVVGHTISDYEHPYRTSVSAHAGKLIRVKDFAEMGRAGRAELTAAMESSLKDLTAEVSSEHADLVEKVQQFYRMDVLDPRRRISQVEKAVQAINPTQESEVSELKRKLDRYFALARDLWVHPGMERQSTSPLFDAWIWISFPLSWIGWLMNFVPLCLATREAEGQEIYPTEVGAKRFAIAARNLAIWHAGSLLFLFALGVFFDSSALGGVFLLAYLLIGLTCTLIAVGNLRWTNVRVWSLIQLPKFKRYQELGEEILLTLNSYRTGVAS